jgi:hypothetical protein
MRKIAATLAAFAFVMLAVGAPAIVINEFMYKTEGGNYFIELNNRTNPDYPGHPGQTIDITGWKIQKGTPAGWTDLVTVQKLDGTSCILNMDECWLVASNDVFVALPDQEGDANFVVDTPTGTDVLGLRLVDTNTGEVEDTVLYGLAGANNFGVLYDDTGSSAPTRIVEVDSAPLPGGGTVDTTTMLGSGVRREDDDGALGDGSEGMGADTNDAAADFWGYETGGASPKSLSTPVTLSVFEAK